MSGICKSGAELLFSDPDSKMQFCKSMICLGKNDLDLVIIRPNIKCHKIQKVAKM